jgi:dTDP-4-amino-4,6-dideoxygalactose transaminase
MIRPGFREWLAVGRVFLNGHLLRTDDGGLQMCRRFEAELAAQTGAGHALAVSSGTAGLICALQACGIGPGDEVLVPAYTWMATAGAVLLAGAVPVLVEIDATLTMDVADLRAKLTPRSRAVIPVHMINRPCDMDAIGALARDHGLRVIEDASQAAGVTYRGRMCGTLGDAGVLSFNQHKNMTSGEGGAVLTDDAQIHIRAMNAHDMGLAFRSDAPGANTPIFVGNNYRISEITGAILRVQLSKLPARMRRMQRRVAVLSAALRAAGYPVAPHHDAASACGVALTFDTEAEAVEFARRRGARRLFDNSKHVFTEWQPILQRRMAHPGMDPWVWAGVGADRRIDDCPRTLDLLRRSCAVNPMADLPMPVVRIMARRLAA